MNGTVVARGRAVSSVLALVASMLLVLVAAVDRAAAIVAEPSPNQILISELRFAGPSGAHDGYVELYNPGSASVTVTGWKLNYALSGSGGTASVTLPPATIAPSGHLLVADSGYSLGGYAAPDVTTSLSASPTGVQLTSPDGTVIVDAVGQSGAPAGFFSGTPLAPNASAAGHQTAWVRRYSGGAPANSNSNASDFALVATDAATMKYGQVVEQGAPAPMGLNSPMWDPSLQSYLLDNNPARNSSCAANAAAQTCPPNRVVSGHTLIVNRMLTNSGSQTLTVARLRMTLVTTYGAPGASSTQAILVPESSSSQIFSTSTGNVRVNGITLDQPPSQPNGGGLNSSLTVPLPNGGLAPGQSIPISIDFNIVQGGTFNATWNAEAGLGSAPPPAPTISVTPTSGHPAPDNGSATGLTVSGTNWTPGHTITVSIGGQTVCSLTADGSGNISGTQSGNGCQVPRVPAGSQPLTASDNSNSASSATGSSFTVQPAIYAADANNSHSSVESPGDSMDVSGAGFAASSQLTFKLDSTTLTPSGGSTSDGNGVLSYGGTTVKIPQGTSAGTHTLTVTDGSGNSASQQITVYAPTVSVAPTSGSPAVDHGTAATGLTVSGGGWPSGDSVTVSIGGQVVCTLTADGSGNISGTQSANGCQLPNVPAGSQPLAAADNTLPAVQTTGSSFTVNPAIHVGDASTPSSTTEVPGGTMDVSAAGFAASSQLTIKFDSTTLTPSGTSKTDSTGTLAWGNAQITVPQGASAGSHTITVTDAAGNTASQTITVNRVAVAVTPTSGHPGPDYGSATGLTVSGGGWTPNDAIVVQIDNATVCSLTADGSGNISGNQSANGCQVPRVPAGSQALTAYDSSNPGATQTGAPFTVTPAIHVADVNNTSSSTESPGANMYVAAAGFAGSKTLTITLDSTTLTPSGSSTTDSSGTLGWGNAQITLPANTTAGTHTITVSDGAGNSASQTITVFAPTVSVTPTTGNPAPDYGSATGLTVTGGGWPSGDSIVVKIGDGLVCDLTADSSGNISGTQSPNGCQVPQVPNGSQALTAYDSDVPAVQTSGASFTVKAAIHVGDTNSPSSTTEVPGGTMGVSAAGFAASSQLTIKFDSTTLTPSGTSTTDSTGFLGWGNAQITVPQGASAGSHTITVTDAAGNSASETITVNRVAVAVTPTSGNPVPDGGSATGLAVSGGGWTPNDSIVVQIDAQTVCVLTATSSGNISGNQLVNGCQVPRVPAGSQALTAYDSSNPGVTQTGALFTVTPAIHAADINDIAATQESPGGKLYVSAAGFAAGSQLTFKFDSTTLTPSGTTTTDSSGTLGWGNAQITVPGNATAGAHTITVTDGAGNSASQTITVFAPTVSVTPTTGNPAPDFGSATGLTVSGGGWPAGDLVVVKIGAGVVCDLTADSSGNISGTQSPNGCQVPQVPNGSEALTAYDDDAPSVTATGSPFTVKAAIHAGDVNNQSSTTEAPGSNMYVSAAGFAANSQLTITFDSTTLTPSGTTSKTDSTGTVGWGNLEITVPAGASAGSHTITVTDASGNSASQTITVNRVAVAVTPTSGHPAPDYGSGTGLTVSGGGWKPSDYIIIQIDNSTVCGLYADSSGNISGNQSANGCQVPPVPAGSQALSAYDSSNPGVTQTGDPFTVTSAIHAADINDIASTQVSPGGKMYVSAAGFAASSQLTFKLDSTTLTPSGTSTTDSSGTLGWGNAEITVPSNTAAGAHTITVTDAAGNSASQTITVFAPTVSVTPTSGNPQPDYGSATGLTVSGGGWPAGDSIVVQIGGGTVCYLTADGSGNISSTAPGAQTCSVPRVPNGSQALTAYDTSGPEVSATGSPFTVKAAIHAGDVNNGNSTTEVPGGNMYVSAAGFAASSQLTIKFDSTTLTPTGTSITDSSGTVGWSDLQITVPQGASAGSHTITVTDAAGNSASQSITINRVAVAVTPTSGNPQSDYGSATGLTVSGGGWTPNDTIVVQIDNATVCDLTADSSGNISGSQAANGCQVPRVPAGSQALTAYDNANPGVTQTGSPFTVNPGIHVADVNNPSDSTDSPGANMYVAGAGFAPNSKLTVKFDSTTVTTTPASPTSDSSGIASWGGVRFTVPSTSAGSHTITMTDAAGNSASQTITVYTPTLSLTPTTGNPAPDYGSATGLTVSGGGWPAGDSIVVQIGSGLVCVLTSDSSGNISGNQSANGCQVPRVPNGSEPVSAYDSSYGGVTASDGNFSVTAALYAGDPNNPNSTTEAPGATVDLSGAGFAANSSVTFKFDGTSLASTPSTPFTDANGDLGWGSVQVTVPSNASAGSHTITATDASGHSASATITVQLVAVAVSPTSGSPQPDYGSATGLDVSGTGWTPHDYIVVEIGNQEVCELEADSSGTISGNQSVGGCQVPRVPVGSQTLSAYDTANPGVTKTGSPFTIVPAIHAGDTNGVYNSEESPGSSMYVSAVGFAANSALTFTFDGAPITSNPATQSTDASGSLYFYNAKLTIPANATAGTHTITVKDASGDTASQTITVFRPTVSVSPTSGSPQPDYGSATGLTVSGSGWPSGDPVYVQIAGQTVCGVTADAAGDISGNLATASCQVPRAAAGSETVSAYDASNQGVDATGSPFTVTPTIHAASPNNQNSTTFAQGAAVDISGAGFAANSPFTVKFDGTTVSSSPAGQQTDGNGTIYWGWSQITVPANAATGTHTITVTDGTNSASQTVTVEQAAVTVNPTTGTPGPDYGAAATPLGVLGSGWTPGDNIVIEIGGQQICSLTADGSGSISGSASAQNCQVPREPAGSEALSAYDSANPGVTQTGSPFTIAPAIHAGDLSNPYSSTEVPGASMYVTGVGFAANSVITYKLDGQTLSSTPAGRTTDGNGTLYFGWSQITIPSNAAPGSHTLAASDAAGNTAITTITVYTPTISVTPTSGNPTPDYGSGTGLTVSGSGWPAGDYIYAQVDGQTVCGQYADASGNLSGSPANCQLPRVPAGSQAVTGVDTSQSDLTATGSSFTVKPVLHAGDPNDPYTTNNEAPGASINLTGAGFAAGSALKFTFDGAALASTPASPSSGSDGSFGWGSVQVAIPSGASAGSHTIVATDGSGNSASVTVTVAQVAVAVSPSTGHPEPDYGSATGLNVSGNGWTPNHYIIVQIGGQSVCGLYANASGNISGSQQNNSCQVPRVPFGSQALTAYDSANQGGTLQTGASFSVTAAIHTGDQNNVTSTTESPGAKVYVSAAGFAANSALSFTFDGAPMTSTGSGTTTDGSGDLYFYNNQLTIPSTAAAGLHAITATDAAGHSASEIISVNTATVSLTPSSGSPAPDYGTATKVSVSGNGWPANDSVVVQIDGQQVCTVSADGSGKLASTSSSCVVPRVPAGNEAVTAYASQDPGVTASGGTFQVKPVIRAGDVNNVYSQVEAPGSKMYVGAAGFAANSGLTFTFDGSPMTSNPGTPQTDSSGTLYVYNSQLTIPANATAGQHTITAKDASGNTASQTITVFTPTLTVTPTSGHSAPDYGTATGLSVSGSGWPAGDTVVVQIGGQGVCNLSANGSGNISGSQQNNNCQVPRVPFGSQAITAYASQDPGVSASDGGFTVQPAIHVGDVNNVYSQTESAGGQMYVGVTGLAANSALTFTFDGSPMTSNPASQSTDSNGYLYVYYTQLTIPANATPGQHTITVKDASGHSVSQTITVLAPTLSVSPTLGSPAADYGTATSLTVSGSGWPAGDTVVVEIGGLGVCNISADASGNIYRPASTNNCLVPRVPVGSQPLTAYASQDPGVAASPGTFTVQPVVRTGDVANIYRQAEAPGANVYVGAAGFAKNSALTFTFDGATLTPTGSGTTTDGNGYLYVYSNQLTIPSTAAAGLHTIKATDAAGNSATETIQIYTPTVSVTPTSGAAGSALTVSGDGWPAGDYVYVQIGGQTVCGLTANASGTIGGDQPHNNCSVPSVASGSQPLTAYDTSQPQINATGQAFSVS